MRCEASVDIGILPLFVTHCTETVGDDKHLLFECSELQDFSEQWARSFSGLDTVQEPMWQEDLVSVASFLNECLGKRDFSVAGAFLDGQAYDQPDMAGRGSK